MGLCRSASPSARRTGIPPSSRCWPTCWPATVPTPGCSTARRRSTSKPTVPACAPITTPARATVSALRVEGLQLYKPRLVARYNRVVQSGQPYRRRAPERAADHAAGHLHFRLGAGEHRPCGGRDRRRWHGHGAGRRPYSASGRRSEVSFGAGASSNTGARVGVQLPPCQPARPGLELDTGLRLEQKKQTAYADIFLPPDETLPAQQHRR